MKLFRAVVITLVIFTLLASPAMATPKDSIIADTQSEPIIIDYSREQFVSRLAKVKGTDLQTAEACLIEFEQAYLSDILSVSDIQAMSSTISYHEFLAHHNFGAGTVVEAGVLFIVTSYYGPYRGITGIVAKWTIPVSSGNYTWTEAYHVVDWNAQQITQMARGVVSYAVNVSTSAGIELRNALTGAGFTLSSTVGTTWYYRKVESWSATLNIFQY